jgi:acyl-CoA thioesterase-1
LNLQDGVHPNAAGIDAIVARILPQVEELVARVQAQRGI